MFKDFNLLATTSRGNEGHARSELSRLLIQIGDSVPIVRRTGVSGLIAARTALNPFEAVDKFRSILHDRPYEFRYMLRVIPVEKIVSTDLEQLQQAAADLGSKIGESETFRITVEKRFTTLSTSSIIEAVASKIKSKVNLTKPDKILLVEVVGAVTGMSVVGPEGVLSVLKEKLL